MQQLLIDACEEGGVLEQVVGYFFGPPAEGGPPAAPVLEGLLLRFSHLQLAIFVSGDDEVELHASVPRHAAVECEPHDLGGLHPWSVALGRSLSWAWHLENQQGYTDGLQLELRDTTVGDAVSVQLMCIAGRMSVRHLVASPMR